MSAPAPRSNRFPDPASSPVVAILTVAAIAVFVADLAEKDISPLVLDVRAFMGEPWRIFTTSLPHANALHLGFNLLWLVRLGAPIEQRLGTLRFAVFALLVDGGASLAEYALGGSSVGLSGLGYALFGFGWVARHDPRFGGLVDRSTALLFVGWFIFCIGATMTDILPVANVAHGAGALFGALAAMIVTSRATSRRIAAASIGLGLLGLGWPGATRYRPLVNFTEGRGADSAHLGWKHLDAREDAAAEPYMREAVRMAPHRSDYWYNLGIALSRQGKDDAAIDAYRRARDTAPGNADRVDALVGALSGAALKALRAGDFDRATALYDEALTIRPDDAGLILFANLAKQRQKPASPSTTEEPGPD